MGVLGEDVAVQVGDGELVAVGDDEDLFEDVFDVDLVDDLVDVDGASGPCERGCRRAGLPAVVAGQAGIGLAPAGRTTASGLPWVWAALPSESLPMPSAA